MRRVALGLLFATASAQANVNGACTPSEKWGLLPLDTAWAQRFRESIRETHSPVESMAFAQRLRQDSDSRLSDFFSEYWLSRSLVRSGHFPLAEAGFERILSRLPAEKDYETLRLASFQCLGLIHHQFPSRQISRSLYSAPQALPMGAEKDYWLFRWAIEQDQAKSALKLMSAESDFAPALKALIAYEDQEWSKAGEHIDAFLMRPARHPYLKSQLEHWRLFAGRVHYSASTFSKAMNYWGAVDRRSNELVQALTEVAWAQLKSGKYNDAIGTSLSLQTGWLQNTYSPEGLMVMAMAFNETCHYPEAMRATELLRSQYEPVLTWLKENKKLSDEALYEELVKAMRKKDSKVPYRLASEWIRSPRFLSRQVEVNALLKMNERSQETLQKGRMRQKERVQELLKLVRDLKTDIVSAQKSNPDKLNLPDWIQVKLDTLKGRLEEYDALRSFAPVWKQADNANKKLSATRKSELTKAISRHVAQTNERVMGQILDIYDNLQFVEVEIYQGATQDMIFTNSHPDYQKKLSALKNKEGFRLKSQELSWGQISTEQLGQSEIWEDELGGFKADLPNKCDKSKIARSQ